ncbi:hypothetical protein [Streptomyces sp. NPDC058632]|uniref:hypothetical protein n=1 Tax=Streptomyces sp. NPDC058632 TaxID=3346567 RepID=UPI00365244D5
MTQKTAAQKAIPAARTRRRLRSGTVMLGGMGVLAAALSACSSDPDRRCVDRDSYDYLNGYKVVADQNCTTSSGSLSKGADADWYYDADVSGGWADDGTFSRSEAVDRGGFGSSSGSSGG